MPSDRKYRTIRALEGRPVIDTRKRPGDRHKPGYVRPNRRSYTKSPSKWEIRSIVAWDGEGANLENGTHIYNLLANSNGDTLVNPDGLQTNEILNFMLDHSSDRDINVIYGGSYDVNMILKDVPKTKLKELWETGSTYWRTFRIMYAPRKKFTVQKIVGKTFPYKVAKTFVLWDVIGYFQSSFVVACQKWLGDLDILNEIQTMKLQRSTFTKESIDDIIEYNKQECMLLVLLMDRLFKSLDEAELQLMRYDGAGSIAAALLKKYDVAKYKGKIPNSVYRRAQHAYSGGRIEAIKCGTTVKPTKIYRYDINSAYPYACLFLPSYVGAKWAKESEWDGSHNSIACVRFHFSKEAPFYPLWYRDSGGGISYPREGYGMYWGAEVSLLYEYYQEGLDFEIEWALNCTLEDEDTKPFAFLQDIYETRKEFKRQGSMASESLKLGMNSCYGKVVQQAGYRNGRVPTYHQLLWGGQITAYTRATLFRAAMQSPNDIISFATDAVFTTKQLDLVTGNELGDWSYDEFIGITIVQAGVYFLQDDTGKWHEKFRGFDKGSLDREKIVQCWEDGTDYEATLTRFIGLGSALASTDFNVWRTWRTDNRALDIRPTGKRIAGPRKDYSRGLRATKASPNITPEVISQPYAVVWMDGVRQAEKESVNGIPLEQIVDEYEDGVL